MSEVKLPLGVIMQALFPPQDVETVSDYQTYLKDIFAGHSVTQPPQGRPMEVTHPHISPEKLKIILAQIKKEAEESPELWCNENGRPPRRLDKHQPDDPSLVRLDNGVTAQLIEGLPPVVYADAAE